MGDAADIEGIAQQVVERPPTVAYPTLLPAAARDPSLANNVLPPQVGLQGRDRAALKVSLEDILDCLGFSFVNDELPVLEVVTERQVAAHPHPLALGGSDLVADALPRHLALELGKREQHVQR